MEWLYEGKEVTPDILQGYSGFVYIITNIVTGKKYIGKKLLLNKRTKVIKGKKKRFLVESDWDSYYGSNDELREDIEALGKDSFRREILRFCKNKGSCNYWELKYQILHEALERDDYYNQWIYVRIHRSHIKK